jgi:hypothetical protein
MIDPKSYVLLTVVQPEEPFTRFYSDPRRLPGRRAQGVPKKT